MSFLLRYRYAAVILAVLVPRIAWFTMLGGDLPRPTRDQAFYLAAAGRIVQGHGLSFSRDQGILRNRMSREDVLGDSWSSDPDFVFGMVPVETPTASFEPGYPLLLAGVVLLAGPLTGGVFMLNCLFAVIGALALMRLVSGCWGRRQGLLAALIWSLYPYYIYYTAYAMTETVHIALLPVILLLTVESVKGGWRAPAAGVATGLLFLVRSTAFFLLPLQILWLLCRRRWRQSIVLFAGFAACCVPWVVRNQIQLGSPVLMPTKGSLNLWMRNNPEVLALEGIGLPGWVEGSISRKDLLEYPSMEGLDTELERSGALMDRAVEFLAANPLLVAYLTLTRAADFLSPLGGTVDHPAAYAAGFLIYLPIMIAGMLEAFRRRREPVVLLLVLAFALYLALHSLAHGGVRYRLPVDMVPIVLTSLLIGRRAGWEEPV